MERFSCIYVKQSSRCKDMLYAKVMHEKHTTQKQQVQMVFLMMNTRCSKHVEETKNWIKTLV